MKKVALIILISGFSLSLWAQNRQYNPIPVKTVRLAPSNLSGTRLEMDTLFAPSFSQACGQNVISFIPSGAGAWGYLSGTNNFADLEKAQRLNFSGSSAFNVQEIWAYFAGAIAVGDADITAKVYTVNGNDAPDLLLATSNVVKTSAVVQPDSVARPTPFTFLTPVAISDPSFVASIDLSALYAAQDTAGLFTTDDRSAPCGSGNAAWERWQDNTWHTYTDSLSWQSDIDNYIGVLIEFTAASIDDPKAVWNNLSLRPAYPNPANNQLSINFELAETTEVSIQIYSIDGKVLQQVDKSTLPAGSYQEILDIHDLAVGTYTYSVAIEGAQLMSRFVVVR